MAKELKPIDVSDMPELLRLAEEVGSSGETRILRRNDTDLAILAPIPAAPKRSARRRGVTKDDPLWNIVGIGQSDGPTDVSTNKHKYLAEASLHKR